MPNRKDPQPHIITLITDFGTCDYYAGAMKGVILGIAPSVRVVDVTHEIEAQNILHGAFVLRQVWSWFPPGTVHLAVVDPGVGSKRRIIVGRYEGRFVVAPDNGLVTFVHREFRAEAMHIVEDRRYFLPTVCPTFHGRDIMAPVAAYLATGTKAQLFGRRTDRIQVLPASHRAALVEDRLQGGVLYVDRFGNLITNIHAEQLALVAERAAMPSDRGSTLEAVVNGEAIGTIRTTFADVPAGQPLALVGSTGYLEVAICGGSAAVRFGPPTSITVEVR